MTITELAAMGINIDCTPRGVYFVSVAGWGRRIGTDYAAAHAYAVNLAVKGLRQP